MEKNELKATKKAWKKGWRKAVRPFRGLRKLTCVLMVIFIALGVFVNTFDNTIALFFVGNTFWELKDSDESAKYYTADYNSEESKSEAGYDVAKRVEEEGASLLYNDNKALPLAKGSKLTLMSNSSVDIVFGGTGSGNVDASKANTLKTAMEMSGFEVNPTMWDFYSAEDMEEYARGGSSGVGAAASLVSEVPWSVYTDEALSSIKEFGDAAVVTISRIGGEGADLSFGDYNYLALDDNEKEMLSNLKAMKNDGTISKIVMLINSSNPLQMDFMKNNDYDVDAILWIGGVGIAGLDAIGEILCGDVNPSGSLVDTYCYDNYSSPAMVNNVPTAYAGDVSLIPDSADTYEIYQEGIYVGYKYYETRYEDVVMGTGNAGSFNYNDIVAYPFGYGLSYTDFEYSDYSVNYSRATDEFTVNVKVTNTGDYAGKETVQIYAQSPYTDYDKQNSIEKASVALVGFGKTNVLEPGKSETLSIIVDKADLASYDYYGAGTYILDEGTYYLTAAKDSHDAINNVLAAKEYAVDGNAELTYAFEQAFDNKTYSVSKAGAEVKNQLSDSDINTYYGKGDNSVTYLSRNDWMGTWPSEITELALTDEMVKDLQLLRYNPDDYEAVDMPVMGAKNGLSLIEMMGLDYDDPKWEQLLDQLTFDEMVSLVGDSFHWTMPVESVNAPGTRDENGPQGLTATLFGAGLGVETTAFTSEDVMAATFNTKLMEEVGAIMGNDCLMAGVTFLYGPGNNIHRTPYGGRNFEYYSEDGFLSGKISAAEVSEIEKRGVHVAMKHFALNDTEQDRIGLGVWLPEQAAREIYLKAFQEVFEEGNANGTMVAYTRWGCVWSGGYKPLMTNIMRNEWGNNGLTITDNVLTQYVNGPDAVMAGGVTTFDAMLWYIEKALPKYKNDPIIVSAMREACHHNLYAIVNSRAMNGMVEGTTVKRTTPEAIMIVNTLAVIFTILYVLFLIISVKRSRTYKRENPRTWKESNE